jgi:hypothetical protein
MMATTTPTATTMSNSINTIVASSVFARLRETNRQESVRQEQVEILHNARRRQLPCRLQQSARTTTREVALAATPPLLCSRALRGYQYAAHVIFAAPTSRSSMFRIAAVLVFVLSLAACDAVDSVTEGLNHAKAVENDLEKATGIRPKVGFNWNNGRLISVSVQFPRIYESKQLGELAETVRSSVGKEFKQTPENIVLAFALGK